jgi:hypothetical protein
MSFMFCVCCDTRKACHSALLNLGKGVVVTYQICDSCSANWSQQEKTKRVLDFVGMFRLSGHTNQVVTDTKKDDD